MQWSRRICSGGDGGGAEDGVSKCPSHHRMILRLGWAEPPVVVLAGKREKRTRGRERRLGPMFITRKRDFNFILFYNFPILISVSGLYSRCYY